MTSPLLLWSLSLYIDIWFWAIIDRRNYNHISQSKVSVMQIFYDRYMRQISHARFSIKTMKLFKKYIPLLCKHIWIRTASLTLKEYRVQKTVWSLGRWSFKSQFYPAVTLFNIRYFELEVTCLKTSEILAVNVRQINIK